MVDEFHERFRWVAFDDDVDHTVEDLKGGIQLSDVSHMRMDRQIIRLKLAINRSF